VVPPHQGHPQVQAVHHLVVEIEERKEDHLTQRNIQLEKINYS
jgi:hypothetical protein